MLRQFFLPLVLKEGVQEWFWGSRRSSLFLRFEGGEQYFLSTERASKQTNDPVFTSEDHIDCKVNKKKAEEQGSIGTPRLALSDVKGLESLSVPSAAPTALRRCAAHTESSTFVIRQLSRSHKGDRINSSARTPC